MEKCFYCANEALSCDFLCEKCRKAQDKEDLMFLKAGICHIHLCSLLERYNPLEGGVSRYCPDCEDEALGCCPF